MHRLAALSFLVLAAPLLAQEGAASLDELLERVRQQTRVCETAVASAGRDLTPEECLDGGFLCVRVRNISTLEFETFKVHFPGQAAEFGPIGPGETSSYRRIGCAYWYNYTDARSEGRRFLRRIIDHVGEALLSAGLYTLNYRVQEFDEPRFGDGWTLHGYLGDSLEVDEHVP